MSAGPHSKNAAAAGQTIVWVDEAGFYLLPTKVRTYAPRGQTPVLHVPLTRDHVSTVSSLSEHGQLLVRMQRSAYRSQAVVRFLKHLLQHVDGKILVIWDGAPKSRVRRLCRSAQQRNERWAIDVLIFLWGGTGGRTSRPSSIVMIGNWWGLSSQYAAE